ncbi:hypothetical protein NDU88_000912 [Pleurodeles waltl]|uniref:Uncharacterized protein n=2 Tax=Pleurodeles waltl TaxID=8319 RepID=A0AAV7TGS8_PLEWA|nr:hypothetical protein NDU88_000912 [Pleurodeles waltl]
MALCPSLCEIESDDIKQIGFILSPEGEEVTKALFFSDCIRRLVLQAEVELMKEGIRLVQGNVTEDETQGDCKNLSPIRTVCGDLRIHGEQHGCRVIARLPAPPTWDPEAAAVGAALAAGQDQERRRIAGKPPASQRILSRRRELRQRQRRRFSNNGIRSGVQDAPAANATPPPKNNWPGIGSTPPDSSVGNQDQCDKSIISLSGNQDNSRAAIGKVLSPPGNEQLQTQQMVQGEQLDLQNEGRIGSPSGYTVEENNYTNPLGSPKKRDNILGGKNPQLTDWGRESSDKFYSLTEESDLGSADCSFSETDESETSETGNKSPSGEHTVRKARQRKSVKSRSGLQEGSETTAPMSGRTLRWDYSGISLADIFTGGNKTPIKEKTDPEAAAGSIGNSGDAHAMGTETGILQSIYSSIKELQTETRIESRRARVATKRLQGSVRKVVKSCMEIEAKLCSMEDRIVAVEDDIDTLKEQNTAREGQLTDVMWKIEDLENRQRRNNLRFLGIPEGLEGDNIQAYMVVLLRGAFPELGNRDWDNECIMT